MLINCQIATKFLQVANSYSIKLEHYIYFQNRTKIVVDIGFGDAFSNTVSSAAPFKPGMVMVIYLYIWLVLLPQVEGSNMITLRQRSYSNTIAYSLATLPKRD